MLRYLLLPLHGNSTTILSYLTLEPIIGPNFQHKNGLILLIGLIGMRPNRKSESVMVDGFRSYRDADTF